MNKEELIAVCKKALAEGVEGPAKEKIEKALELAQKKTISKRDAMSLTCWGSLVFCCATPTDKNKGLSCAGKNCFWRDAAVSLAGLTPDELNKLKAKWHKELLK
jgi:predicted metal-binding transcription factor (methanogenesis marker protein 9)